MCEAKKIWVQAIWKSPQKSDKKWQFRSGDHVSNGHGLLGLVARMPSGARDKHGNLLVPVGYVPVEPNPFDEDYNPNANNNIFIINGKDLTLVREFCEMTT